MSAASNYSPQERTNTAIDQSLHHKSSAKRKRDPSDQNGNRKQTMHWPTPSSMNVHGNGHHPDRSNDFLASTNELNSISQHIAQHLANASPSTAAAALAANMPHLTVPQPTELSFPGTGPSNDPDRQLESSFDLGGASDADQNHHAPGAAYSLEAYQGGSHSDPQSGRDPEGTGVKPAVGTDEWHKVRRDNHKEGKSLPIHKRCSVLQSTDVYS